MTAYSSAQAGNWNSSSTWSPSGVPGVGDTITLITHQVDVTDSRVIGGDPAADTTQVTIGSGGILNITGTLQAQCSIECTQGEFRLGAGGTFEWSCTNQQRLYLGTSWQGTGKARINGTSGNRATFNKVAGDFRIAFHNGNGHPQDFQASYCDFDSLGNSSNDGINATLAGTYLDNIQLTGCVFTDFWDWDSGTFLHANAIIILTNCTFKQHASSTGNVLSLNAYNTIGTGTRKLDGCVFDAPPRFWERSGVQVDNCIFQDGYTILGSEAVKFQSWSNNFVVHSGANVNMLGDITDDYWIVTNTGATNPHAINTPDKNVGSITIDGVITEFAGANKEGDFILIATPGGSASQNTVTVRNCIQLPNSSDSSFGTLLTALGDSSTDFAVEHSTIFVRSKSGDVTNQEGIRVGETYAGHSGMINSIKSNIFWTSEAGATTFAVRDQSGTTSGIAGASDIDYNCSFNTGDSAAFATKYSNFSGSPSFGAADIDGNPQFVDASRNLASWAGSIGETATNAGAIAALALKNENGFNSEATFSNLRSYIIEGFQVQNASLKDAGHDGQTIGAAGFYSATLESVSKTIRFT